MLKFAAIAKIKKLPNLLTVNRGNANDDLYWQFYWQLQASTAKNHCQLK